MQKSNKKGDNKSQETKRKLEAKERKRIYRKNRLKISRKILRSRTKRSWMERRENGYIERTEQMINIVLKNKMTKVERKNPEKVKLKR